VRGVGSCPGGYFPLGPAAVAMVSHITDSANRH